jgi:hypothetical protein
MCGAEEHIRASAGAQLKMNRKTNKQVKDFK